MDKWKREVGCIVVFIYIVEEQLFIAYHIHRFERKGDFAVFAKGRAPRWWERLGKTRGVPFSPPLYFRCDSAKKKKTKKTQKTKYNRCRQLQYQAVRPTISWKKKILFSIFLILFFFFRWCCWVVHCFRFGVFCRWQRRHPTHANTSTTVFLFLPPPPPFCLTQYFVVYF